MPGAASIRAGRAREVLWTSRPTPERRERQRMPLQGEKPDDVRDLEEKGDVEVDEGRDLEEKDPPADVRRRYTVAPHDPDATPAAD